LTWNDLKNEGIEIIIPEVLQNESSRPGKYAWVFKMKGKPAEVAALPVYKIEGKEVESKILFSDPVKLELSSDTQGATIFITLDGSTPTTSSQEYTGPLQIENSVTLKAMAEKSGKVNSLVSELRLFKASKFKSIDFEKSYSPKYSGLGNLTLGDGEFGGLDYTNKKWLGFEKDDMIAIIDVGEIKLIKNFTASFLHNTNSWIFSPAEVKFLVSTDGKEYTSVAKIKPPVQMEDTEKQSVIFGREIKPVKTRFVKVWAKNIGICPEWHKGAGGKAWIFTDEIMVE